MIKTTFDADAYARESYSVTADRTELGASIAALRAQEVGREQAERRARCWEDALDLAVQIENGLYGWPDREPDIREHDDQIILVLGGLVFGSMERTDSNCPVRARLLVHDEETVKWAWSYGQVHDASSLSQMVLYAEVPDIEAIGIPEKLPAPFVPVKESREPSPEERIAMALEAIAGQVVPQ